MLTRSMNQGLFAGMTRATATGAIIIDLICERFASHHLGGRKNPHSRNSFNPRAATSARGPRLSRCVVFGHASSLPKPMRSRHEYPLSARGFVPSQRLASNIETESSWHGQ
jgi:hypothetical protein